MNSFQDKLFEIEKDLTKYKNNDKVQLFENYVKQRLARSTDSYYKDMFSYMESVSSYNPIKVQRRTLKLSKDAGLQ